MAEKGLPVVLVDGMTETVHLAKDVHHERAASTTPFLDGKDGELRELIMEMENFPNVRRVSGEGRVKKTLLELGVYPRTAFAKENKKILTAFREDQDIDYIYLYHYMYTEKEPFTVEIELPCAGRLYQMDCWSGRETELNHASRSDRGMLFALTLKQRHHFQKSDVAVWIHFFGSSFSLYWEGLHPKFFLNTVEK